VLVRTGRVWSQLRVLDEVPAAEELGAGFR